MIDNVKCNAEEQETVITFNRNDKVATVYTCDNTMLTKMKKYIEKNKNIKYEIASIDNEGNPTGYIFEVPKKYISIRSASTRAPMSEEERKKVAERFQRSRENKNG